MILAERVQAEELAARAQAAAINAEADAANTTADLSSTEALISHYKLEIKKLRRQFCAARSERTARLLEQMELQLDWKQLSPRTNWRPSRRRRDRRQCSHSNASGHRASCPCCGSNRLSKLGEDITETLAVVPRQWRAIRTCARSSPAGPVRRSPSLTRRST
jgi:hypothetical protein